MADHAAKIGFIGLGNMGSGMCANLAQQCDVRAFDLDAASVERAVAAGAAGCDTLADAVAEADVVVTMLPAGQHVHSVYFDEGGVLAHAPNAALLIDCSTIAVTEAREAAAKAQGAGFTFVDAPVSGGVAAAEAGTLTFMVGGADEGFARAEPVLAQMGKNVFHAGVSGNGQAAKVANNMLLAISMIGTAEAFNLAQRLGLDAQTFFDIASNASGQCWSMTTYCPAPGPVPTSPANRDYEAGFTAAMMLKDLNLARDAAAAAQAETPLGAHAAAIYSELNELGVGPKDFSIVMRYVAGELR